jgi:Ca-activated chloride channel family protein
MDAITFASPTYFILLLFLLPYVIWYVLQWRKKYPSLQISGKYLLQNTGKSYKSYFIHIPFVFRILALVALIVALARPQTSDSWQQVKREGIDIVLALDVSTSMLAEDFQPNRLEASKVVAAEFISGRPNDRIGLVTFAGESFTQCPITTDHGQLINLFRDVHSGVLEDGTAIGLGLGTAIIRLKDSSAKSKVIILLTDGVNNSGEIAPNTAAEIAVQEKIRVYTIGVGTMGEAKYPVQTPYGLQYQMMKVEIDEAMLKEIASKTDGKYFRATNNKKLRSIYDEINKLEKTKLASREINNKTDLYFFLLLLTSLLLAAEITIRQTILRSVV